MEKIAKIRKIIRISKKKALIFVIIVAIISLVLFKLLSPVPQIPMTYDISQTGSDTSTLNSKENTSAIYPGDYPYQNPTPSVQDTREFLKTSYNTEIQTRDVKNIIREIKNAVIDASGRIDGINENSKDGYVSFVVPKSNFENFKNDIEDITNEKLIIENVSSLNLLNQKQSIEQQQITTNNSLLSLEQQKKDLLAQHTQTKNKLQSEITNLENTLYAIDPGPTGFSAEDITYRQNLSNQITQKKQQINTENSTYNTNNQNLNNQINIVNNQIQNIAKQDSNFNDNIETINGYISVRWISLWEMAKIFSPISPVIIIIFLVIVVLYLLNRKNYLPKIEFV